MPRYTTTRQAAEAAIANGGSMPKISFDSSAMTDRLGGMNLLGAEAGTIAPYTGRMSLFYGAGGPLVDPAGCGVRAENAPMLLNAKPSRQRVTITGRIGKYATLVSRPVRWYTSAEVKRAYDGRGNGAIWDGGAASGGWESFFNPKTGSLARYVSQLVLISDYYLEVTIYGQYNETDLNVVRNLATRGAWPLFSSGEPPTQNIAYQQSPEGIVATNELGPGNIQIWGVTVQQAP